MFNFFSRQSFFTTVLFSRVSCTCGTNYSVYDGGRTHTHLSHAHFSQFVCAHSHILMRVHIHAWPKSCPKGVSCTCVIPLHLAYPLLVIHPSLLFLHGHFETHPDYDFTDDPIHMILPYFPVQAQDTRHSAPASRSLATWPSQRQIHFMSPRSSTRSLPWMMTRCSSTIRTTIAPTSRKPRTRILDNWVFPQCLHPLFRTLKPLLDRNRRKRRFCDQCCRIDVKEESTEQYLELFSSDSHEILLLWRVTENPVLKRLSENSILMDEISEHIFNEELDKLFMVKIQLREDYIWMSTSWRYRFWNEEIWIMHHSSHSVSLDHKDSNYWKIFIGQIKFKYSLALVMELRIYVCSRMGMKDHLHQESYARSCREIEELKRRCCEEGNFFKKTTKIGRISYAAWSGITNRESILLRFWLTVQLWHTYVPHQALITSSSRKPSREIGMPRNTR